jgi:NADPH:quinone reductase
VLDGLGGAMSVRSFRALRPGGRLVVFGYSSASTQGRRSRRAWLTWNAQTASVFLWGLLSPRRPVHGYRIDMLRNRHPDWFREDFLALLEVLRRGEIHPIVSGRPPLTEVRRAHELLESSAATGKLVLVPEGAENAR